MEVVNNTLLLSLRPGFKPGLVLDGLSQMVSSWISLARALILLDSWVQFFPCFFWFICICLRIVLCYSWIGLVLVCVLSRLKANLFVKLILVRFCTQFLFYSRIYPDFIPAFSLKHLSLVQTLKPLSDSYPLCKYIFIHLCLPLQSSLQSISAVYYLYQTLKDQIQQKRSDSSLILLCFCRCSVWSELNTFISSTTVKQMHTGLASTQKYMNKTHVKRV